jgi:predicted TIM-barrel fold metal-dependent hydrolase
VLDHGGLQGWWSQRFVEEAMIVAAAHDNVYLETGLWWTDMYMKALLDPNIGPEKLIWGCDWGASIPFHAQYGNQPPAYAVQLRKEPLVRHQVDVWGWSLKQLLRLDIVQDDLNLILGGNAARLYGLPVPHKRLFRPVGGELVPQPGERDSIPPRCS